MAKLFGCSSFVVLEPLAVSSCLSPAPELSTWSGMLRNVSNISSPVLALSEQLVPLLAPSHSTQLLPFFFFVMSVRTSFISLWVKFVDSWLICLLFLSISNVFLEKGCLVVRFLKDWNLRIPCPLQASPCGQNFEGMISLLSVYQRAHGE